jgi:hypothetical protein
VSSTLEWFGERVAIGDRVFSEFAVFVGRVSTEQVDLSMDFHAKADFLLAYERCEITMFAAAASELCLQIPMCIELFDTLTILQQNVAYPESGL